MRLELLSYQVKDVLFSGATRLDNQLLYIDKEELESLLVGDSRIKKVEAHIAKPGEPTRIIHVLDIIEPRTKTPKDGSIFPGFLGPPRLAGEGRTFRLEGVAVIEAAEFPYQERGLMYAREQIIDMAGPGAAFTPFAKTVNLVLTFTPRDNISPEDYDDAIRRAGLQAAKYLADAAINQKPDSVELLELAGPREALPKVAYVCQVSSSGPLLDTFLYGVRMGQQVPTLIHPNEMLDGAVVSGYYAPHPIPTFVHCNNRVIRQLYMRDGKEVSFLGVILSSGGGVTPSSFDKERSAYFAAKLAKVLKADGVVITQEGGGNSILDQMLACRACEELGIKTTLVSYEMAGDSGTDIPAICIVAEANAIVSMGNREEKIVLPSVERVLGGEKILFSGLDPRGALEIMVQELASSIDQTGFGFLRAKEF